MFRREIMKKSILYVVLIVFLTCGSAFAGRTWFYNEVTDSQGNPIGQGDTVIGMRSGNAWPVVAYSDGSSDSGTACMLPGAWAKGPVSFINSGRVLDGATAPDSTVGFVSNTGQVIMLNKTGWSSSFCSSEVLPSSPYKNSIAFNNNSVPGVLYRDTDSSLKLAMRSGGAWYSSTVQESVGPPVQTNVYALDFDSYNQANAAFWNNGRLCYATKGVLTGNQWVFNSIENAPVIGNAMQFDMALAADDVPYVLYSDSSLLKYAVYDRHSDSWMTGILDALENSQFGNFCVTADSVGGIGVAYVANFAGMPMLSYAYNNGSDWTWLDRLVEARPDYTVGLAFDYENNPVISFVGMDGRMQIAYDPQEIPEPATLAVLALGFALIRRR
jgi:hypothetical protein